VSTSPLATHSVSNAPGGLLLLRRPSHPQDVQPVILTAGSVLRAREQSTSSNSGRYPKLGQFVAEEASRLVSMSNVSGEAVGRAGLLHRSWTRFVTRG